MYYPTLSIVTLIYISLLLLVNSSGSHTGHRHNDDTLADCSCVTGKVATDLNCATASTKIKEAETFLSKSDNNCLTACKENKFDNQQKFRCLQWFFYALQYHSYCATGTINETLIHEFLENCPDCLEKPYVTAGAPDCSGHLDCNDTASMDTDIDYVNANCLKPKAINCSVAAANCGTTWLRVQGYHRMCSHHDLTEKFDEVYDKSFANASCNFECNVPEPGKYPPNCTATKNNNYNTKLKQYGNVPVTDTEAHAVGLVVPYIVVFVVPMVTSLFMG